MATRFVRVDLSDEARDYRPMAIEPGVPMLDRSNANAKILFRWVGGLAAEPVWDGDSVNFYVRDNRGGRLEEVLCQPASEHELRTLLQDELGLLKDRLEKARAETPTERVFRKVAAADLPRADRQPRPHRPGQLLLPLSRPGKPLAAGLVLGLSADRPGAGAGGGVHRSGVRAAVRPPAGKEPQVPQLRLDASVSAGPHEQAPPRPALGAAVAAVGGRAAGLEVPSPAAGGRPNTLAGPVGSRFEVKVLKKGLFSKEDVTGHAVGVVLDPAVARFDQMTGMTRLVGPGGTKIRFQMGDLKTDVNLEAAAAANPEKITIEPRNVELAPGSTARLKLIGHYKDGTTADLTAAAEWKPQNDKIVFAMGGFLEGLAPGAATVSARYRATPESPYVAEAAANVSVAKIELKSLEIGIEPAPVGRPAAPAACGSTRSARTAGIIRSWSRRN